jgi:hypothetical protein
VAAFPVVFLGVFLSSLTGRALAAERFEHGIAVDIHGPLALVTVDRFFHASALEEQVWDLDLPEGAALLGAEIEGMRLEPATGTDAQVSHQQALAAWGMASNRLDRDPGADVRVRLAGQNDTHVRIQYIAPLTCLQGQFVLRVPGSLEAAPVPAHVTLRFADGQSDHATIAGVPVGQRGRMTASAPARATWDIALSPPSPPSFHDGTFPAHMRVAAARVGRTKGIPETAVAVGVCRASGTVSAGLPPERVLLAIDRSRSVGPAGLSAERDVVLALLKALPPSVRFNAVWFDRDTEALFPLARTATGAALEAVAQAAAPAMLKNGTDLPAALGKLAQLAKHDDHVAPGRTWLVVITDGAMPETLDMATAAAEQHAPVAVLVIRPAHDDPPSPIALRALGRLPAYRGGILRVLDPGTITQQLDSAVAALRTGGDLHDMEVASLGSAAQITTGIAPGAGAFQTAWVKERVPRKVIVQGRFAGYPARQQVNIARAPIHAMEVLRHPAPQYWRALGERWAIVIERGPAPSPVRDPVARGQMDRQVVRNVLSLAFLPRARACYLRRPVRNDTDMYLRGRVRLELHLERGEMREARVLASTLGRPDIEACVREAAFQVEIPRPLHRDAPVVAILNLLFQPQTDKTGDEPRSKAASQVEREIDLILGPISLTGDPAELLETPAPE